MRPRVDCLDMIFAKIAITNLPTYPQQSRENYRKANFLLDYLFTFSKNY